MKVIGNKLLLELDTGDYSKTKGGIILSQSTPENRGKIIMIGEGVFDKSIKLGDLAVFVKGAAIQIPEVGYIVRVEDVVCTIGAEQYKNTQ